MKPEDQRLVTSSATSGTDWKSVLIDRDELRRLYTEANEAGLEGRVITGVEFVHGPYGAIEAYRLNWMPAPTEHRRTRECGCDMCRR